MSAAIAMGTQCPVCGDRMVYETRPDLFTVLGRRRAFDVPGYWCTVCEHSEVDTSALQRSGLFETWIAEIRAETAPPPTRADCASIPRPCNRSGCRYFQTGVTGNCVLDQAEESSVTLKQLADLDGFTAEYLRQQENRALLALSRKPAMLDIYDRGDTGYTHVPPSASQYAAEADSSDYLVIDERRDDCIPGPLFSGSEAQDTDWVWSRYLRDRGWSSQTEARRRRGSR